MRWRWAGLAAALLLAAARMTAAAEDPGTYFHDPRAAALARAGASGTEAEVAALIAGGTSPNAKGDGGVTPLLWTVGRENVDGIRALLAGGGDPYQADKDGVTALSLAISAVNPAVLRAFIEARIDPNRPIGGVGGDETPLMEAVRSGKKEAVATLLRAGANPNATDRAGRTALTDAAVPTSYDIAVTLLEAGADPTHRDRGGKSFLDLVAFDDPSGFGPDQRRTYEALAAWLKAHGHPLPGR